MNNDGYIYVLLNPAMEGLVKIGKTKRDPAERMNELSSATGVPTPFILVYKEYFDDCDRAEQVIHSLLEDRGYRLADNREFFYVPVHEAIKIIQNYKGEKISSNFIETTIKENILHPLAFAYLEQAKDYYYGTEDTLQDYCESYSLFKKSSDLGSLRALEFLGKMTAEGKGCNKDLQKALDFFKRGAKLGNRYCYAEMAQIYAKLNHTENVKKCYSFYFNKLDYNLMTKEDIFYLTWYVDNQFGTIDEQYIPILTLFKKEIILKLRHFTQMAIDSHPDDKSYVNFIRTFRGKRISWLESLEEPDWEPTLYDVFDVVKLDEGVVIFADVIKGISYSLSVGDRILLQSPSKTLEAEILFIHGEQTSPSILISKKTEDYDKYLFIKEGAALKRL